MRESFLAPCFIFALFLFILSNKAAYSEISAGAGKDSGWTADRPYRISLQVSTGSNTAINKPVEYRINFTDYLDKYNIKAGFDDKSIKVIEVDSLLSSPIDTALAFQFDKDSNYNSQSNASGMLIFIMKDSTKPNTKRCYQVYFDTAGKQYQIRQFSSSLDITDNIFRAGQSSFRITAKDNAQYYFHKQGAGFASMIDKDGKDWIDFNTTSINKQYRGIPNMGPCAHPGFPIPGDTGTLGSISTIVSKGPLKIKIHSITTDNNWEFTWEFFPEFARMTLLKKGGNYWFLCETVPNGNMDLDSGYSVRNTNVRLPLSASWTKGILPSPKWIYFGDTRVQRVIYAAMHEPDNHNDFYRPYLTYQTPENMTVFGFGRQDPVKPNGRLLTLVPAHFTIGFAEDTAYSNVSRLILSNISTLNISRTYDPPAQAIPLSPALVNPKNNSNSLSDTVKFSWNKSERADTYQLQVSGDSTFNSIIYNNSGIKDTSIQLNIFTDGTKYFWRVCAANSYGKSSYSQAYSFITSLNKPDQLLAKFVPPDDIRLNWTINSKSSPWYIIEKKTDLGSFKVLDTTKSNVNSYTDTSTSPRITYTYRVRAINQYSVSAYSNEVQISYVTAVNDQVKKITEYSLGQNYPNPFNPVTTITYAIPQPSYVELKIYNLLGREVMTLVSKGQNAGEYKVQFDGSSLPGGMYIYSIRAGNFKEHKKLLLLK